jgi:hypothetical protein
MTLIKGRLLTLTYEGQDAQKKKDGFTIFLAARSSASSP